MEGRTGNCRKLRLLLWKNYILLWGKKCHLIVAYLILTFLMCFFLAMRLIVKPTFNAEYRYSPMSIDDLKFFEETFVLNPNNKLEMKVLYSPKNDIYEKIVNEASNKLKLDPCMGYGNSKELIAALMNKSHFAGVQFDDDTSDIKDYPKKFKFSLRFPSEFRNDKYNEMWPTDELFDLLDLFVRNQYDVDGGYPSGYIREGFIPLQHALAMAFIKQASNRDDLPEILMQRFPDPEFVSDILYALNNIIVLVLVIGFTYLVVFIAKDVAEEQELQLKAIMKISGVMSWLHWLAWFISWYIVLAVVSCYMVFMLKTPLLNQAGILFRTSWTLLLVFLLIYCIPVVCLCFLVAIIFSKSLHAAIAMCLLWFITLVPLFFPSYRYEKRDIAVKLLLSLLPNTALNYTFYIICFLERYGEGLQWSNLIVSVSSIDKMKLSYIMLVLLLAAIIYGTLCLYVERIHPGEYHIAQKWYFPCQFKFLRCKCCTRTQSDEEISNERRSSFFDDYTQDEEFVDEPEGTIQKDIEANSAEIGIKLESLGKRYGNHWAVKGITLNIYFNEITILLGHNGAGKTTTILMLTGIVKPTKGNAYINGYNILTDLDSARESIGLCPQHNVLFNKMSVKNHIKFFSGMKGVPSKNIKIELHKFLKLLSLEDKAKVKVKNLSGGMKRKLALCCAMCGNSRILICDEPTSGIDAASRRQVWDLLNFEKNNRAVLLSTHYLDEAEVLGNRIAIMNDGQLVCYGSALYLKNNFGSGYKLICEKDEGCETSQVTNLLKQYVPQIEIEKETASEATYRLPSINHVNLHHIFKSLEMQMEKLKLSSFGVRTPTLEEVFIKFGADKHQDFQDEDTKKEIELKYKFNEVDESQHNHCTNCCFQWRAMFLKYCLRARRNWLLFWLTIFVPILMVLSDIMQHVNSNAIMSKPPLDINFDKYSEPIALLHTSKQIQEDSLESYIAKEYEAYVMDSGAEFKTTGKQTISEYLLQFTGADRLTVDNNYLAAATIDTGELIAWLNNQPLHTAPLTLNVLHNALARSLIGSDTEIKVTNAPIPFEKEIILRNFGTTVDITTGICIGLSFSTAFCAVLIVREQATKTKFQQYVGGLSVFNYWFSQYLWHFLWLFLTGIIISIMIKIQGFEGLSSWAAVLAILSLITAYALAVLPFTYIICLMFSKPAASFIFIVVVSLALQSVVPITLQFGLRRTDHFGYWIARIIPILSLSFGIMEIQKRSELDFLCKNKLYPEEIIQQIFPQCIKKSSYFSWKSPGILPDLTALLLTTLVYAIILIVIDIKICLILLSSGGRKRNKERQNRAKGGGSRNHYARDDNNVEDEDVAAERQYIAQLSENAISEYPLVVDELSKKYSKFKAVKNISFHVKKGECFGLLGVNGAGKTTTFKMLTGDTSIRSGNAYIQGISLRTHIFKARKRIGYCPQFDALFEHFTGRETLQIYCLLKGIHGNSLKETTRELSQLMGFTQHLDKKVLSYSGGNKRKLSTAVALLGNPSIIFLDEPTTGIDPATRLHIWKLIQNLQDYGKSIVLTSHSMDECEQLPTRLTIMVQGVFKCIGSVQNLKRKFSKGFVLKMKVYGDQKDAGAIVNFVIDKFSSAQLKEEYQGYFTFHIPKNDIKLSYIFELFEKNKQDLKLEFYTIGETGIEDIFLDLVRKNDT